MEEDISAYKQLVDSFSFLSGFPGLWDRSSLMGHLRSGQSKTERKQLMKNIEAIKQLICIFNDFTYDWEYWLAPDGKYVWFSPMCKDITGYAPEELMAKPELMYELVHPDDRSIWVSHWEEVVHGTKNNCCMDFRIVNREGKTIWINHVCRSIYTPSGVLLGRHGYNRDITSRKEMEQLTCFPKTGPFKVRKFSVRFGSPRTGGFSHEEVAVYGFADRLHPAPG